MNSQNKFVCHVVKLNDKKKKKKSVLGDELILKNLRF